MQSSILCSSSALTVPSVALMGQKKVIRGHAGSGSMCTSTKGFVGGGLLHWQQSLGSSQFSSRRSQTLCLSKARIGSVAASLKLPWSAKERGSRTKDIETITETRSTLKKRNDLLLKLLLEVPLVYLYQDWMFSHYEELGRFFGGDLATGAGLGILAGAFVSYLRCLGPCFDDILAIARAAWKSVWTMKVLGPDGRKAVYPLGWDSDDEKKVEKKLFKLPVSRESPLEVPTALGVVLGLSVYNHFHPAQTETGAVIQYFVFSVCLLTPVSEVLPDLCGIVGMRARKWVASKKAG